MHALARQDQLLVRHGERCAAQHAVYRLQTGVAVRRLCGPQHPPFDRFRTQAGQERSVVVAVNTLAALAMAAGPEPSAWVAPNTMPASVLGETHQPTLGQHHARLVRAHVVAQRTSGHHHQAVIGLLLGPLRAALPQLQRNGGEKNA